MVIIADPDVMLDGVARHHRKADGTSQFHTYRTFFEQVRITSPFLLRHIRLLKPIILPRQARDKHRKRGGKGGVL
jgi:hypothetical protein